MKRFQSILCASLLTLSISSATLAGQISGKAGQISGAPSVDTSKSGWISGIVDQTYTDLFGWISGIM